MPRRAPTPRTLLADEYWNDVFTHDDLVAAHRGSTAWVSARDASGALVASARAISDGGKLAWIYDVIVAPPHRRAGVGQALVRLLLDHPRVRSARRVLLGTRDAQSLYARLGFFDLASASRAFPTTTMLLLRDRGHAPPPQPLAATRLSDTNATHAGDG